jgi:uncharacterized metal-binding protein YceD (DUF177 family)
MKAKDYVIEFPKLRAGINTFRFELNDTFLASFEGEHPQRANVIANVELDKSETMLELRFRLNGTIEVACDICLDLFDLPIESEYKLILKISEVEDYSDDEIVYITPGTIEYDLGQYLYECLILSVPIRKVCGMSRDKKECNPVVLEKLKQASADQGKEEGPDPRWDKLKGIFN